MAKLSVSNRSLTWAIIASQFAGPFMFSGVAVALPTLGQDLGARATSLGLMETLFLAGSAATLLPLGRLADASDKRTLYKVGLLTFALSSVVIGVLSWMPGILFVRFLQGVTSALASATAPAILAEIVPPERRGRAYGASIGVVYAGLSLGPIAAGFLVERWGWRAVFLVGAGGIFGGLLLVHALLPSSWRRPPRGAVHLPSSVLIVASILLLVAGTATLRAGAAGALALIAGGGCAVAFVLLQRRLARPLLDVGALVRNRVLSSALTVQLLLYMNAFCAMFLLSLYMQVPLEHSATTSGRVLAIGSVLMALLAPVAGSLSDRYHPGTIGSVGVSLVLASALLATSFGADTSLPLIALMLGLQGVGFALFSSPNMTLLMGSVPPEQRSLASALGAKARSLGMVGGMVITAVLLSLYFGDAPVERYPTRLLSVVSIAFSVLASFTTLALLVSVGTRLYRPRSSAGDD